MTKDQLALLGMDFCQFDANKLQHGGGSGLGLAIAQGIIDQHNGTITTESDGPGMGTTFTLDLPLYDIPRARHHRDNNPDTETTTIDTGTTKMSVHGSRSSKNECTVRRRRVLVVEDAESSQKMLIRLLERDGHSCAGVGNGQKAVDAIAADLAASRASKSHIPFDTILMDFEMPVMNGRKYIYSVFVCLLPVSSSSHPYCGLSRSLSLCWRSRRCQAHPRNGLHRDVFWRDW
jgi:Histidine kinase-, DNA gyrase B-, and HSP90-like ATPase